MLLSASCLCKRYGATVALDDVSVTVRRFGLQMFASANVWLLPGDRPAAPG
jgi:hypothetical protein